MDNLAHTLVGACLGRAVAGHRLERAALLGAVAANAPDWCELFTGYPWPGAQYLAQHRGITHSLLGAGVEIVGLTILVNAAAVWWARRRGAPAVSLWWILGCVAICVLSHLYMDWQGSYGLRPFLPWSGRWFYGDFVAIVDPIFWCLPLAALAWGAPRDWRPALLVAVVALPIGWLLFRTAGVTLWLRVACEGMLAALVFGWLAHWFGVAGRRRAAAYAVVGLAVYAGAQAVASIPVRSAARRAAIARFGPGARSAPLTIVGYPFRWNSIVASGDSVAGAGWQDARHLDLPLVQRALRRSADARALAAFARFLVADVDSAERPAVVYLRDARYAARNPRRPGWAAVAVPME